MGYVEPTPEQREAHAARLQEIADATAQAMAGPLQRQTMFAHCWPNGGAPVPVVVTVSESEVTE